MSQSTATRRRRAVAYADSRPPTGTNSAAFALTFLLIIGCVTDVQGVALLPLLGKMEAALHLSGAETSWAINSLSIATAVMVGLSARSADVFGHRKVLIPMLSFGIVGSVLCALSSNFALLLVGRVVIGLCVCAPMSWAMLKIRSNEKGLERAALWNGTLISIMTPLGLILGGVLLDLGASWSSFFWIVAAGYLILLAQVLVMPETPQKDRIKVPVDWLGSLGIGAWLVCLLLALSFGGSWGWDSPAILPASFLAAAISKPMLARFGPRPPIALGGVLCVIAFTMMAFLHSSLWLFYVEVAIYGVGIIIAFNVGWALTASAGRQDNMSTTFGIQYALALPTAALATAVIIAVETVNVKPVAALGGAYVPKEGVYVAMFLLLAVVSLLGYVINGLFIVPKNLRHQSARLEDIIAAEDALETGLPVVPGITDDPA